MELYKLHITNACLGTISDCYSVSGGDFWVGGALINLTNATGLQA